MQAPAAGAEVFFDVARLLLDGDVEVADKSLDGCDLRVGIDLYVLVLSRVDHLRGQDARRAVEGREGLVELRHLTADSRLCLDDVDRESGVGDVERGLDTRDTAAYNERALCDGRLAGGERRVEIDLSYRRLAEDYSLGGSGELVLVYPRALLADVRDLEHI